MAADTVRVRILVAVDQYGQWTSAGDHLIDEAMSDDVYDIDTRYLSGPITAYHWIEADLPIPAATVIEGRVSDG